MITFPLEHLSDYTIGQIAGIIRKDWKKVNFAAAPYLEAMRYMDFISDSYGYDDGKSIVRYFLSNASTWRGETAKAVKSELKSRL
jgi:hypothetical protein